jgi:hypothetical protein
VDSWIYYYVLHLPHDSPARIITRRKEIIVGQSLTADQLLTADQSLTADQLLTGQLLTGQLSSSTMEAHLPSRDGVRCPSFGPKSQDFAKQQATILSTILFFIETVPLLPSQLQQVTLPLLKTPDQYRNDFHRRSYHRSWTSSDTHTHPHQELRGLGTSANKHTPSFTKCTLQHHQKHNVKTRSCL